MFKTSRNNPEDAQMSSHQRSGVPPDPDRMPGERLLAAATDRACMAARWEAAELLSRRTPEAASDLLRGRAAELAGSAAARHQLLSLALDAAADDIQKGVAPLTGGARFLSDLAVEETARRRVQREVLSWAKLEGTADIVVGEVEAQHRRELGGVGAFADLAGRLLEDARLHKLLWDDPRLPADVNPRRALLASIPRLIDRARSLDPMRLRSVRSLLAWTRPRKP